MGRAKRELIMQRALAVEENDKRERSKQVSSDQCMRATGIVECKVLAFQVIYGEPRSIMLFRHVG